MKKTITLKTVSGKELTATIEKHNVMVGKCGECDPVKENKTLTNIFVEYNGEKIEVGVDYCGGEQGKLVEKCNEANVKYFLSGHIRDKRVIIILTAESLEELMSILGADNQENNNDIIVMANEIIENAKTTVRNENGTLMNKDEAKIYLKSYNDLYNEGGEGYLPSIITAEQFEWANKIISENH